MTDVVIDLVGPVGRTALAAAKRAEVAADAAEGAASTVRVGDRTTLGAGAVATDQGAAVTAVGGAALAVNTGNGNTAVGSQSLKVNVGGTNNTALGRNSLVSAVTGIGHCAVGDGAGGSVTGGAVSIFIGFNAGSGGSQIVNPDNAIAIGYEAVATASYQAVFGGPAITETILRGVVRINHGGPIVALLDGPNENYFFGDGGNSTATGGGNVAIGKDAGDVISTGVANTFVGKNAGKAVTTGNDHTFIGSGAGEKQIGGVGCCAMGRLAGKSSVNATNWTALGDTALEFNVFADGVVAVGYGAGRDYGKDRVPDPGHPENLRGFCAVGTYAGGYSPAADRTTVIGIEAFNGVGMGADNTGVGYRVGHNALGAENTAVGSEALWSAGTFTGHTAVGFQAAFSLTGGSYSTFLGWKAGNHANQKVNATGCVVVGAGAYSTRDNEIVIGKSTDTHVTLAGVTFTKAQLQALLAMVA